MNLGTRLTYFLLGLVLGVFLGYIMRMLREVRTSQEHTDKVVTERMERDLHKENDRSDAGSIKASLVEKIALLLVVLLTAYAAVTSQVSSNRSNKTTDDVASQADKQQRQQDCLVEFQSKLLAAINARTEYSIEQGAANLALQKAQSDFLSQFISPNPPKDSELNEALRVYFRALISYIDLASKTNENVKNNPYPTVREFQNCLNRR